jgi:DNA-binding LytR/AlgR family response regulator
MDAFDGNGIAYLLKPFSKERFQKAWNKYFLLRNSTLKAHSPFDNLTKLIQQNLNERRYKKRFTINTHKGIYFLETVNILFFEANEGVVFAYDTKGKKNLLTHSTLNEIEEQLNPLDFFRINRSELIHKSYIEKIDRYNKNTLAIKLKGFETHLKTSQSNTATFRAWLEK